MKNILLPIAGLLALSVNSAQAQTPGLKSIKDNRHTEVKDQGQSGTCWNFSTTSLVESQTLKNFDRTTDLSEMFETRNVYIEKARNYLLRQGKTQFGEGGLGHDLIKAIEKYGAIPQQAYSGMKGAAPMHQGLEDKLKGYLDSILKQPRPVAANWLTGYESILNTYFGVPPQEFDYEGRKYTPLSFAKDYLKFNADDYVNITSFTHHPYYKQFVLEAPDNFSNGLFYNLPLEEMLSLTEAAVSGGYTVMWDADVSNKDFQQKKGYAVLFANDADAKAEKTDPDAQEKSFDAKIRQELYENLTTQDDHLMHLVGVDRSPKGKVFFKVKNSWGNVGPFKGYIEVSKAYFAINTISLVVPKAAIPAALKAKLGIN